jgi:hypothetical protein
MKVAVLISGSPRFSRDLDTFINGLTGATQVDWFCHVWKFNSPPDKLGPEYSNYQLVANGWRTVEYDWAYKKLTNNLTGIHQLKALDVFNNNFIEYPTIIGQQAHPQNFESIVKMHLGWKRASMALETSGEDYDLVIRARPDLFLPEPLNLLELHSIINNRPDNVITSNGGQHGYHGYNSNDIIAISSAQNIHTYADLINHSATYNQQGVIFHPETLLAYHLRTNGLVIAPIVRAEIRATLQEINGVFSPDFGQWA